MHQSDVYGAIGALILASQETQPLVAAVIRFAPLGAVVPQMIREHGDDIR